MKKQKTVIMLEDIKENICWEKSMNLFWMRTKCFVNY